MGGMEDQDDASEGGVSRKREGGGEELKVILISLSAGNDDVEFYCRVVGCWVAISNRKTVVSLVRRAQSAMTLPAGQNPPQQITIGVLGRSVLVPFMLSLTFVQLFREHSSSISTTLNGK